MKFIFYFYGLHDTNQNIQFHDSEIFQYCRVRWQKLLLISQVGKYSGGRLIRVANARKIVRIIRACELSEPILH